jgi:tetratricopeptide (TPR) repeat protein
LALLAAMTVALAAEALAKRSWRDLRAPALAVAVALGVTCLPLADIDRGYEEWVATADLGVRWLEVGQASAAEQAFVRAIQMESAATPNTTSDPDFRRVRGELRFNHATALRALGRDAAAIAELEAAAAIDPANAHYLRTLADAYRARGRVAAADSLLARVPALVAGDAELAVSEGYRAAREGRFADATAALERAVALDARLYGAWGALIRAQVLGGDLAGASATLPRAAAAGMPPVPAAVYEALVAAARGDSTATARALARVGTADLDPTLRSVADWSRAQIAGGARR